MNKFSRLFLGLKALLGQKAPSSAVTDTQLDWDNHSPSEEEQAIWEEMAFGAPVTQFRCGTCDHTGNFDWCHSHKCTDHVDNDPFETCTVCNNDKFVGQSKVEDPFVCGWCKAEDVYVRGLIKAEKAANKQAEAMLLKEVSLDRLSDAVDALCKGNRLSDAVDSLCKGYPEPEWEEQEECPCSDEGCYRCNPL